MKEALRQLQEEGLVSRLNGRGVVVGPETAPILRPTWTRALLGRNEREAGVSRVPTWQKTYHAIEHELIIRSAFGRFRVNESNLAHHYKIGRTVAHEVLTQIQSTGILMKGEKAQWFTVPLDRRRLDELYELRELVEPALIANAASRIPPDALQEMREQLLKAMARYPKVAASHLDDLENDVHVTCLEYGGNLELLGALRRTRCIIILSKHILETEVSLPKTDPFFEEHLQIIEGLYMHDADRARLAMLSHLRAARNKVADRLVAFRKGYLMAALSFVTEA